jgi:hypothetical protein
MPQRAGPAEIELAKEQLAANRDIYWCVRCARPRKRLYCPANARGHKNAPHQVVLRMRIKPEDQLASYIYQGELTADE